jgi:UDP-N-acetylmuramate dehydrogenase
MRSSSFALKRTSTRQGELLTKFRNPPGANAAWLIESAGLKGYRIGGAAVSATHAACIIDTGAASAADVERLIRFVRIAVKRLHQVELEPAVRVVGRMIP